MNMPNRIVVVGATGTLGGAVAASLVARQVPFTALVRRPATALEHPLIEQRQADLGNYISIRRALEGATSAFYVSPHAAAEIDFAHTFADEAERAGVRIVFAGVHSSRRTLAGRLQAALIRQLMPAYRDKLSLAAYIEKRGTDAVMLTPTSFFQNDQLFLEEIRAGHYPVPLRGFNMISASDIGEIAATALIDRSFPGGSYTLMGPRTITGRDAAEAWTRALGYPVAYAGDDLPAWEEVIAKRFPAGRKGTDYRAAFASLAKNRLATNPRHVATTTTLLGRTPQDYTDWAHHTAVAELHDASAAT